MLRKTVSLTLCLSFLILCLSSIMLYIVPEGRVAFWSNWTGLGFSKTQWGSIHVIGGFFFLAACIAHALINIRPILSYLKIRSRDKAMPAVISLALCSFVFVGTLAGWHPMTDVMELSASIKKEQEKIHGNPPYGHAEASKLAEFCRFMRMDTESVVSGLSTKGLKGFIKGSSTLKEIADANGIPPSALYKIILEVSGVTEEQIRSLTKDPGKGQGRRNQEPVE